MSNIVTTPRPQAIQMDEAPKKRPNPELAQKLDRLMFSGLLNRPSPLILE